jgi:hypothetical protein
MRISRHAKAVASLVTPMRGGVTSREFDSKLRANHGEAPVFGSAS